MVDQALGMRVRWHAQPAANFAEALLASAKLAGIERLWFVAGLELTFLQESFAKHVALGRPTPALMTMTHENAALAAACGETMITGRPSMTAFHVDCGLLNAGAAIHNASRGQYPVLITSGYAPSAENTTVPGARNSGIQYLQHIPDQGGLVRQYVKWDHTLATYDNPGLLVTRAAQMMLSEPRGPAYLSLPREAAVSSTGGEVRFPTLEQFRPAIPAAADPAALEEAATWLAGANAPLICVSGVGRDAEAVPLLTRLAEKLGARVLADTFRVNLPGMHALNRGVPGYTPIPSDTDCVLVLECLTPWTPGRFEPDPSARIIRIGTDPLGSISPTYDFPCDMAITGHAASALPALLDAIDRVSTPEQRSSAADRLERLRREGQHLLEESVDAARADGQQVRLTPRFLSHAIGDTLPPEAIILHELVDASLFNRTQPGSLFGTGGSAIGWSAPAAIGVKLAAADRPVVAAVGDGSWMFANPQVTLWASRFHSAPVLFLVFNNRGYGVGTRSVLDAYPEGYAARSGNLTGGWFDPAPNFAAEASASGAYAEKITRPEDVRPALRRGLDATTREGCPALIEFWLPKLVTGEI